MVANNTWVHRSASRTVFVFVHGILSNSEACWRNERTGKHWAELIRDDPRFEDAAVFVSGYATGWRSGLYDVKAASEDVLAHLRTASPSPLDKDRMVFVCHSQGGIVVRQMLCSHFDEFASKKLGIILCASPSWGSWYARILFPLILLVRNRQGKALCWGGETLKNLDREFLTLMQKRRIPELEGRCLVETKGILFLLGKLVPEPSASRYFEWQQVANSSHGSLVKPSSSDAESHIQVLDFAIKNRFVTRTLLRDALDRLVAEMTRLQKVYDPARSESLEAKAECLESLFKALPPVFGLADATDRFQNIRLEAIEDAKLDAGGAWAFHDLSREEFSAIHRSLATLRKSL